MRVKIEGEITAERVCEGLAKAQEQYGKVVPGFKIYGANLYLNAFDALGRKQREKFQAAKDLFNCLNETTAQRMSNEPEKFGYS